MLDYLCAIQQIPGNTVSKKLKWIKKFNPEEQKKRGELHNLPLALLPILRVENAVKKQIYQEITYALKSEDWTVVRRAFRASWFFDGSHKNIVDVNYFRKFIFPYVSLNTRVRLVKTLAVRLIGKDPNFAQQMFKAVTQLYGLQQALVLLVACNEDFTYRIVEEKRIALPYKIVKRIFLRNPDFLVRYLRLSKPNNLYEINIHDYKCLLPRLIKKRIKAFVELCEMHEKQPPHVRLSNKCTAIFLQKGMEHIMRKPRLYIDMLALEKIKVAQMKSIFPDLLPDNVKLYDTDEVLNYLKYFPEDKKVDLLYEAYRKRYGDELLDRSNNVTPALMRLLPIEERIKQAKIKIERDKSLDITRDMKDYEHAWICYLPINKSILAIRREIIITSNKDSKLGLIWQMIYTCKVNNDDDALFDTLLYTQIQCRNENFWLHNRMMLQILRLYDTDRLSKKLWEALCDNIRVLYARYGQVSEEILATMAHLNFLHNMSIIEPIEMLLETQNVHLYSDFTCIINENLQYERQCLETCIKVIQKKHDNVNWEKIEFLYGIVKAMYNFNDRCKKLRSTVKPMTIRDYDWLKGAVQQMVKNLSSRWRCNEMKDILHKHERELHDEFYSQGRGYQFAIDTLLDGRALATLRRNPLAILNNWEQYLKACKEKYRHKAVQRFVRATCWYNDIPIKFTKRCFDDLQEHKDEVSLIILAMLLHGESLMQLLLWLDPLASQTVIADAGCPKAEDRHRFILSLPLVMKLCNPPMPFNLVLRLSKEEYYLSLVMTSLTQTTSRCTLPIVISFAKDLATKGIAARTTAIKIMYEVAPTHKSVNFIELMWRTENHYSVRGFLLQTVLKLYCKAPNYDTWLILCKLISTLTLNDEIWLPRLMKHLPRVSTKYIAEYIFILIKFLMVSKFDASSKIKYIASVIENISEHICEYLPSTFIENMLREYLFHEDANMSVVAGRFAIHSYLLPAKNNFESRMEIFTDIFSHKVKNGWNVAHSRNCHFYPVNYAVRKFVHDLVAAFLSSEFNDIKIIDATLNIFLSVLEPHMDANSYLLLVYATERTKSASFEQFGMQLGRKVPELVNIFASSSLPLMAKTLECFLACNVHKSLDTEDIKLGVMEGLIKADNTESCVMIVNMLSSVIPNINTPRYNYLVEKLREKNQIVIDVILYDCLSRTDYNSIDDKCLNKSK